MSRVKRGKQKNRSLKREVAELQRQLEAANSLSAHWTVEALAQRDRVRAVLNHVAKADPVVALLARETEGDITVKRGERQTTMFCSGSGVDVTVEYDTIYLSGGGEALTVSLPLNDLARYAIRGFLQEVSKS